MCHGTVNEIHRMVRQLTARDTKGIEQPAEARQRLASSPLPLPIVSQQARGSNVKRLVGSSQPHLSMGMHSWVCPRHLATEEVEHGELLLRVIALPWLELPPKLDPVRRVGDGRETKPRCQEDIGTLP